MSPGCTLNTEAARQQPRLIKEPPLVAGDQNIATFETHNRRITATLALPNSREISKLYAGTERHIVERVPNLSNLYDGRHLAIRSI
jgi:hypothetical protein